MSTVYRLLFCARFVIRYLCSSQQLVELTCCILLMLLLLLMQRHQ